MFTLEEFHQNFLQEVVSRATGHGLFDSQAFFEIVCEQLIESGELTKDCTEATYQPQINRKPVEIHGYDFDEERGLLSLIVHQFFQEETVQTLTLKAIEQKITRLINYFIKTIEGLYRDLEETSPEYHMSQDIFQKFHNKEIERISFFILTDGKMTRSYKEAKNFNLEGIPIKTRIIDIDYLYKSAVSKNASTTFEVETRLPCLEIPTNTESYKSFLTYITGQQLFDIYEQYGSALLEQNVRTFLQFKGGVNKGIRNTISGAPEMFFAYNNGITATATDLEFDEYGNIRKIYNLQIVNGGQTTSAIYAAKKNSKLDVSKISVQMKLSVITDVDNHGDFVSKVAEYANTQNKINKSDFFSNSPFHKQIKEYSKRIIAPARYNEVKMSGWYYERVRGEYLNDQAYLTDGQKNAFLEKFPKEKKFDKTFLSKSENVWRQKPDIVSKGAQYSFADFAIYITDILEKNHLAITEQYFKDAISKLIIFKSVEKLISESSWYSGGFRSQTVAYTISYLAHYVEKKKKYFNFTYIWNDQEILSDLKETLNQIAEQVHKQIINPPNGEGNPGQWAKKASCWSFIKELEFHISLDKKYLNSQERAKMIKREDTQQKKIDTGIEMQVFVQGIEMEKWKELHRYFSHKDNIRTLSLRQFEILTSYVSGKFVVPSENQAKYLYDAYYKALGEGLVLA